MLRGWKESGGSQPCLGRPRGAASRGSATHTGRLEVLLRSWPKSRAARKWSLKAGISVSVAAKPSSDPPRLMRRGTAGQAAMAAAGAALAKGAQRGRAGALPSAFPAWHYAGGAGCARPSRPGGGGAAIFGPGMNFLPAGIGSGFSRAEGVWRSLSPMLRFAVLLLLRGVPPKLRREQHSPGGRPSHGLRPAVPATAMATLHPPAPPPVLGT